jgi:hypothetical protein
VLLLFCSDDHIVVFHNASYSDMYDDHIRTLVLILSDPLTKTPTPPDPPAALNRTICITDSPSDLYSIIHHTYKRDGRRTPRNHHNEPTRTPKEKTKEPQIPQFFAMYR